ncbi:MAG: hypothetical protein ACTSWN_00390 [Promethearchaeota archaeon]
MGSLLCILESKMFFLGFLTSSRYCYLIRGAMGESIETRKMYWIKLLEISNR